VAPTIANSKNVLETSARAEAMLFHNKTQVLCRGPKPLRSFGKRACATSQPSKSVGAGDDANAYTRITSTSWEPSVSL
jgi:hypothetical protein